MTIIKDYGNTLSVEERTKHLVMGVQKRLRIEEMETANIDISF